MISPVYLAVLFAIVFLGQAAENNFTTVKRPDGTTWKKPSRDVAVFLSVILTLFAGFRYGVGTDFWAYYLWDTPSWSEVVKLIVGFHEGAFALLVKLANLFDANGQRTILVTSAVIVCLYCSAIYKYSSSYMLAMLLYLLMGEWQGSFNAVRQYLASAILFAGHRYILDRNLRKYLLVVFIAALFHRTVVVMVLPYFLLTRKPDQTQLALLAIGAILLRFSYGFLFDAVGEIRGDEIDMYSEEYYTHSVNKLRILTVFIPTLIYLLQCQKENLTKEQVFYINAIFFNSFCMLATSGSAYLARMSIYTTATVIIGYGRLFPLIASENNRRTTKYIVVAMYFVYWLYSLRIGNGDRFHLNFDLL